VKRWLTYRTASYLLFGGLFVLILATFRQYGIAWDELWHVNYGQAVLDYYLGRLRGAPDLTAISYRNLYLYGGAFDLLATVFVRLFERLTAVGSIELRHLVTALVGLLGIAGAWACARRLAGEAAAFWTALFLALTPVYYGHMFFNPKDIPFAAGYIWSLYFILRILDEFPNPGWKATLGFGLAAGLTLGVRVGGVFLLGYFGLALAWNYLRALRAGLAPGWAGFRRWVVGPGFLGGALAYLLMLAAWPYAQQNPLRYPLRALLQMSRFKYPNSVLFNGQFLPAADLPAGYLPRYLLISLPEFILALLLAGALLALVGWRRRRPRLFQAGALAQGCCLLLIAIIIPLLAAILGRSTLYDGMRHFIFIVPPLACLAGISFTYILDALGRWKPKATAGALAVLLACLAYQAAVMVRLHPYEYIAYNRLAGGVAQAYRNYETDYWGTATSAAAKWLVQNLAAGDASPAEPVKVYIAGANEFSAIYYFSDRVEFTPIAGQADYFIGGIRNFSWEQLPGRELFTVARMGVPLAVVKKIQK
jgi:hypothetical protein